MFGGQENALAEQKNDTALSVHASQSRGASPDSGASTTLAGTLTQGGQVHCIDFNTLEKLTDFIAYVRTAGLNLGGR
jgi:hypothetical protein